MRPKDFPPPEGFQALPLIAIRTKGRAAAPPEQAKPLLDRVADGLSATGLSVATGRFGEYMVVELVNEGPATVMLEV